MEPQRVPEGPARSPSRHGSNLSECPKGPLSRVCVIVLASTGRDVSLIRKLTGVRNALDRRVERGVYGDAHTMTEVQRKALRCVRVGRFDRIRLFHLVGKEDAGTADHPLKSLASMNPSDAHIAVAESFQRLLQAITIASPSLTPFAIPFLVDFQKVITQAITDKVSNKALSSWYASIVKRVSLPRRQYAYGESASEAASFDIQFIKDMSTDERLELERATQDARTIRLAGPAKRRPRDDDLEDIDDDDQPTAKALKGRKAQKAADRKAKIKAKQEAAKAARAAAAAGASTALTKVEHAAGVTAGTAVPIPSSDPSLTTKAEKQAAWDVFNTAHPKPSKQAKSLCWDFFHPQGCAKGASCRFAHQ